MATKAKKGGSVRKDKMVTNSISNPRQTGNNSTTKQATSWIKKTKQPTSDSTAKDEPNLSGKPTPNYLRPTRSSRPEPSVKPQAKKPGNEDAATAQKAQLLRRGSFDRPPSASRTHSDPKGPGSRDQTSRSSSFSSTRIPSQKPALDRKSKSFKPVKSQPPPLSTRFVTRTSSFSKNNKRNRSTSGTNVPSSSRSEILVPETNVRESNEETTSIPEPEETVNVESEAQLVLSEPEEENKKHSDDANFVKLNNADGGKVQNFENHNISEEQSVSPAVEIDQTELIVECDGNQQKEEEINDIIDHKEASVALEDDLNKQEENVNQNADMQEEKRAIRTVEEEIKINTEEERKPKKEENAEEKVEERKADEAAAQRLQGGQGRKESPGAYNDVIEETKKKLMEKRKNKVKALVGAFETVIDYETAASK